MTEKFEEDIEIPKWDVALEALVKEEYTKTGSALQIDDFKQLAVEYQIRFDDIMETMFEMCIDGQWIYEDEDHNQVEITRQTLDNLYVNARLQEEDLWEFNGYWHPAG
ncbi:MAG: hypothetical protein ACE5EH_12740 [Gammaproteobacteria bacterium]